MLVSLPVGDVQFLDRYIKEHRLRSRSAALRRAVGLLRTFELEVAYARAGEAWAADGDANAWDLTVADGLIRKPLL